MLSCKIHEVSIYQQDDTARHRHAWTFPSAALETQASEVLPSLRTAPGGRRPGCEDHEAVPMPPENGWEETWIYRALSFELGEATKRGRGGVCWGRMGEVS